MQVSIGVQTCCGWQQQRLDLMSSTHRGGTTVKTHTRPTSDAFQDINLPAHQAGYRREGWNARTFIVSFFLLFSPKQTRCLSLNTFPCSGCWRSLVAGWLCRRCSIVPNIVNYQAGQGLQQAGARRGGENNIWRLKPDYSKSSALLLFYKSVRLWTGNSAFASASVWRHRPRDISAWWQSEELQTNYVCGGTFVTHGWTLPLANQMRWHFHAAVWLRWLIWICKKAAPQSHFCVLPKERDASSLHLTPSRVFDHLFAYYIINI